MSAEVIRIEAAGQRLGLVPALGGGVAEWCLVNLEHEGDVQHLWRPWSGASDDRYSLASFAMLPWSNRISGGGFEHGGHFEAMRPNRAGEPYPIHGDGWLQPWQVARHDASSIELTLASRGHGGNPYHYDARQRFELQAGGLDQSVSVLHLGEQPLPYGLGLHPWFPRTPGTTVQARVGGVWLCGDDPIPTAHTTRFPPGWDLGAGASMHGTLIDNGYSAGTARRRSAGPNAACCCGCRWRRSKHRAGRRRRPIASSTGRRWVRRSASSRSRSRSMRFIWTAGPASSSSAAARRWRCGCAGVSKPCASPFASCAREPARETVPETPPETNPARS